LPRNYGHILSRDIKKAELSQKDPVHNTVVELNEKVKAKKGVWGTFGTKTFALPKAIVYYSCEVIGEISQVRDGGKTLLTKDGHLLENVHAVVFSTGYKNIVSFLPEQLQRTDPRRLYKHMFHPEYGDKIAWIGWARPNFGSQFPVMEMQARLYALVCRNDLNIPQNFEMEKIASIDEAINLEQFERNAYRIRSLVDYFHYMDDLANMIGCFPPLWKYFFFYPRIWLRIVYGATQATQYRLRGPGKKEKLAQEYLKKLPVSKPTHIVKSGIKGRILFLLKAKTFGFILTVFLNKIKSFFSKKSSTDAKQTRNISIQK
jgi:dimethylaniline monooxygenase (N-oxide forming)